MIKIKEGSYYKYHYSKNYKNNGRWDIVKVLKMKTPREAKVKIIASNCNVKDSICDDYFFAYKPEHLPLYESPLWQAINE
jgi:hypothetical protein